ncbi:hypothetical protein ZHAS_00003459 [Anopheles sinensis]|uniref:Uncharacterized protein n=1 Tax=Anopheles sinensis TaxID=74873 RepID=A0A084VEE0_ANOSI|nr:hypothetical protein ZHAS_00003459 [Anopheles sinensis]
MTTGVIVVPPIVPCDGYVALVYPSIGPSKLLEELMVMVVVKVFDFNRSKMNCGL